MLITAVLAVAYVGPMRTRRFYALPLRGSMSFTTLMGGIVCSIEFAEAFAAGLAGENSGGLSATAYE